MAIKELAGPILAKCQFSFQICYCIGDVSLSEDLRLRPSLGRLQELGRRCWRRRRTRGAMRLEQQAAQGPSALEIFAQNFAQPPAADPETAADAAAAARNSSVSSSSFRCSRMPWRASSSTARASAQTHATTAASVVGIVADTAIGTTALIAAASAAAAVSAALHPATIRDAGQHTLTR